MADVLREFLVSFGFQVNRSSQAKAENSLAAYEKAVLDAENKITKAKADGAKASVRYALEIEAAEKRTALETAKAAAARVSQMARTQKTIITAAEAEKAATQERIRNNRQETQSIKDKSASGGLALAAFAATAVTVATIATKVITGMAESMSQLYQAGQRTNSSVKGLQAFGYAAEQLGSNAKEAIGFVEHLAELMKTAPGYEDMMKNMGINTRDANGKLKERVELASELQNFFSNKPDYQQRAYAVPLGMPTTLLEALTSGKFNAKQTEAKSILSQVGVDPDKAAKESNDFMKVLQKLQFTISAIGIRIEGELVKRFGGALEDLQKWLITNVDSITKAFVKIGDGLLVVVKAIGEFAKKLESLSPQQRDFLVQMGALVAAFLAFNSGPIGALVAITAAMVAFLDEEKLRKLQEMWDKFDALAKRLTGQDGLTVAFELLGAALLLKVLKPFDSLITKLIWLGGFKLPAWILRMLGVGPAAVAAAAIGTAIAADQAVPNEQKPGLQNYQDDERSGAAGGAGMLGAIKRAGRWVGDKLGIGGGATDGIHRRGARAARGDQSGGVAANPGAYKDFLDHVARSEGTANRAGGGYNTSLDLGRWLPGGKEQDLTKLTLDQVNELQKGMLANPENRARYGNGLGSSAIGRYQIVRRTLMGLRRQLNLSGDQLFDAGLQDRLGATLARARGASPSGLQQEWASLVGANNATAVALMRKVDPKASTMPLPVSLTAPTPQAPAIPHIVPKIEGALQNFNDRFNDSMGKSPAFERGVTAPLGPTSNVTNNKQSSFTNAPTNNITINGATQPQQVGEVVRQEWKRQHADLLRNLQGSTA